MEAAKLQVGFFLSLFFACLRAAVAHAAVCVITLLPTSVWLPCQRVRRQTVHCAAALSSVVDARDNRCVNMKSRIGKLPCCSD